MSGLKDSVALVTGAGGEHGIGRAIVRRFAQEGANIVASDLTSNARGDWRGLPAVADEIEAMGRQVLTMEVDVTSAEQVEQMVQAALDRFGKIDILVNNAGAPAGSDRVPVVELEEDVFDLVHRVNVKGTFLCSRAVSRHLIERGEGGKIMNIASTAGLRGVARFAAYCSSKFAVVGFTQCLANELGPHGVHVNAICPGLIETERLYGIADGLKPKGTSTEEFRDRMVERSAQGNPLGRMGQPEDVANVAAFLASSDGDWMTGQAISVSGGAVMLR
ncbi:MAG: 3-oxoacyl-ACP reductase family protein [Candidatus Latescibacteria bacterium]|jgi:NAD(P)-dependent dehydrogenase (short-subunit alcohol dehydrogenase family)|nr:3-oxoacyl-ACP reductase family protein [Candidatus Latescibacterota bacterium]